MSTANVPPQPSAPGEYHAPADEPAAPAAPSDGRVRASWTRVLLLGLGAFGVWFLLFAPTLQHNAQVSPVGKRRTVSLDLVGPVASISRALQLSRIVSATGREDSQPGGTGLTFSGPSSNGQRPHHRAGPHPVTLAGPTTTTTAPPDPKLPTAAHPLRVLIVGDSIGLDMGGALQSDLATTGVVNAALDARESTGLTRPDYFNWPAELQTDLKSVDPQVVVVMIGANDAQDFLGPPDVPYTSSQWNTLYGQRVAQFMQIAGSGGATVVWVGMPPMQNPGLNGQMMDIDVVDAHQATLATPTAHFVSTWKSLGTAQGAYTAFVTNAAGQIVNTRSPDGIHLTPGGSQVVAQQVIAQLQGLGYHIP
jgi:hypothetical protein